MTSSSPTDKYQLLVDQEAKDPRFELVTIKVLEGEVKGRWWGRKDQRPILCLHGWLDNCGAFDELIPLLPKDRGYLAVDLPGHGRSYKRPIGVGYSIIDFMVFVERIRRHFNWEQVSIMAHSYSSMSTFHYAALNPDKVDLLIALDSLEPYNYNALSHLRKAYRIYLKVIDGNAKTLHDEPPSYTYDQLLEKIMLGSTNSVPKSLAHLLITRSVQPSAKNPGKYYFTFDPTWKALSRDPRHEQDTMMMAREITCPVLYLLGHDSYIRDRNINNTLKITEYWATFNSALKVQFMPGNHHFLMTHPQPTADYITEFLQKVSTPIRNKL